MDVTISIIKSARRSRSTTMRILNQNEIELRAPERMQISTIIDFIAANTRFLSKSLAVPKQAKLPPALKEGMTVYLFGQPLKLIIKAGARIKIEVDAVNKTITVVKRGRALSRKKFYDELSTILLQYLLTKVPIFAKQVAPNIPYKTIRTKLVRSLWGSCTRDGKLTFNRKLIHYPTEIIDYVIVHELAHLVHHNHSKSFWDLVAIHYSNVKETRAVLNKATFG